MIPLEQYEQKRLDDLVARLRVELNQVRSARQGLDTHWIKLNKAYRSQPKQERKSFPFSGCANLVVPVMAIDVDKVYAMIMALLFGQENLWVVKPTRPDMTDLAPRLQEFLQWAQMNELGAYNEVADWIKELCLLGTGILKTRYQRTTQVVYEYRETQTEIGGQPAKVFERQAQITLHDHPVLEHVPLHDFYVHPQATSIHDSPWVAQYTPLCWEDYMDRVRSGVYASDKLLGEHWARAYSSTIVREQEKSDRFQPFQGTKMELYEFWVKANISRDPNAAPVALVITLHEPTGMAVRVDYNPYFNQEPPYEKACFVRQPKRFYGIGLGDMLELAQEEISTMHNQRIDSNTVRMMPIFWALKGGAVAVDEPLWPGRILHVNTPQEFGAVTLTSGQWTSTAPDEQMTLNYYRERSGVNDFTAGGDGPDVAYAAATTALQQLREGKKRFDQSMREIRQALSGVGTKILELYQQFNQAGKTFIALGQADGALVQQALNFPLDIIRACVSVDITATSAAANKEVEVRTNTLLMQLLQQHNTQTTQTMMQLLNPQMPEPLKMVLMQQLRSSSILMRNILEAYGKQDADDLVTDFNKLFGGQGAGTSPVQSPQQPQIGGGTPMAQGSDGAAPMAALSAGSPEQFGGFTSPTGAGY